MTNYDDEKLNPPASHYPGWRTLGEFTVRTAAGQDSQASLQVVTALSELGVAPACLERIGAAVSQAVRSAIAPDDHQQPESLIGIRRMHIRRIRIRLRVLEADLLTQISEIIAVEPVADRSSHRSMSTHQQGLPFPQGWGFFIVGKTYDESLYTIELFLYAEGKGTGIESP